MNKRYCLQCDDGTELQHMQKDVTVTFNGLSEVVPQVLGWHCPVCGEIEFDDKESSGRFDAALDRLADQAKSETAAFIKATRKKLHLTQHQAGAIFGGGANAFSEYERNVTQPHPSTVKLLRLLDKHPELLNEVRG